MNSERLFFAINNFVEAKIFAYESDQHYNEFEWRYKSDVEALHKATEELEEVLKEVNMTNTKTVEVDKSQLSEKGAKIVAALEEFLEVLNSGQPVEEHFKVTQYGV